jgi:hypothetical protein
MRNFGMMLISCWVQGYHGKKRAFLVMLGGSFDAIGTAFLYFLRARPRVTARDH